jgi:hypothetical protein
MKARHLTTAVLVWSIVMVLSVLGGRAVNAAIISWSGTHQMTITDPHYGMTAYTLAVPNGWKFGGVITRPPIGCHAIGGVPKFTMLSPDGITAILLMPGVRWSWSSSNMENPHCRDIAIDTAAQFLVQIVVPHLAPNARIQAVLPLAPAGRAGLAHRQELMRQQEAATAARYGIPTPKITLDGARVQVQYERDGHLVQERIVAVISCTETQRPAMYRTPAVRRRDCTAPSISIARAPSGHLAALIAQPQYLSLIQSMRVNPQWQRRVTRDQRAAFAAFQRRNAGQFAAIQKHYADVNRALIQRGQTFQKNLAGQTAHAMQADRATQGAIDKSAQKQEMISLNQQKYTDPKTGRTIKLSNQYDHTWISSDGQTTIQDNGTFNPNGVVDPVRSSWQEIYPKQ